MSGLAPALTVAAWPPDDEEHLVTEPLQDPAPATSDLSLGEEAYHAIFDGIIAGRYPAGSAMRERELSAELSVSRVPVREALGRLTTEGFLTTSRYRSAAVRQLTLKDVDESFDLRMALEVLAARQAAMAVAAGASGEELEGLVAEARRLLDAGDGHRLARVNVELHEAVVRLSGNRTLEGLMRPLFGRMRWIFAMTSDRDPVAQCEEHEAIVAAILAGNADLAVPLVQVHTEEGRAPSLSYLSTLLPVE